MGIFVKIIRAIQIVLLVVIILVGGCIHFMWQDYQGESPCIQAGQSQGLTDVIEINEPKSYSPARCAGYRGQTQILFWAH